MDKPGLDPSSNGNVPSPVNVLGTQADNQRRLAIVSVVAILVVLGILIGVSYYFLLATTDTAKWRDLFIIGLTIELFMLGAGTIILSYQVSRLVNLVQTEVRPVLESANETINTLRGTATFLTDNLVKPVVKVNGYIAAMKRMLGLINFGK